MAPTVEFQVDGVRISNGDNTKCIHLSSLAWGKLIQLKKEIDQAQKNIRDQQWKIDAEKDIRVQINSYQGKWYLHIRQFWNDRATKTGVAMPITEWNHFKSILQPTAETRMGIEVMTEMLKEKLADDIHGECRGCQEDWPSQLDHSCLVHAGSSAELHVNNALAKVTAVDFILELAKKACDKKVILEMPHQTMKRVILFHIREVKEAAMQNFTDFM